MSRRIAALAAAATLMLLASCGGAEVPTKVDVAEVDVAPILVDAQLDSILNSMAQVSQEGDSKKDASVLESRFGGTALDGRKAAYEAKKKFDGRKLPRTSGTKRLLSIVPSNAEWPRMVVVVTDHEDAKNPTLRVLRQESARDPYRNVASAPLLPGAKVPAVPLPEKGVERLDVTDSEGALMSTKDAFNKLSDVLKRGDDSEFKDVFSSNPFFDTIGTEQRDESKAATQDCAGCFEYALEHAPREDQQLAIRTADGGIIAIGVLDNKRTFKVAKDGAKLPLDGELKALTGKDQATNTLEITSLSTVAVHIPPSGGDGKVAIIGAERILTGAKVP